MLYAQSYLYLLMGLFFLPALCHSATLQVPDRPESPIVDLAELLNIQVEKQLDTVLSDLKSQTGEQVVVLTVHTLGGEDIDAFSRRVADQWFPGTAGSENSLLLTVSLQEEQFDFYKGHGLDESLSDDLLASIGRETLEPLFNKGRHGDAIITAVSEIINTLEQHHNLKLSGSDTLAATADNAEKQFPWQVVFILMMIYVVLRKRGRKVE